RRDRPLRCGLPASPRRCASVRKARLQRIAMGAPDVRCVPAERGARRGLVMPLKVLHVLDHSVPLHSGYAFRTLAILREQRKLGWGTREVTTPKHGASAADEEEVEGFTFLRTRHDGRGGLVGQMLATRRRLAEAIARFEPDLIHCHSPILTALPGLAA